MADRQSAQGMEVVEVDLGTRTYPIYIGSGLLGKEDGALLRRHVVGSSALVVTNSKLAGLLLDQTVAALKGGDSKLRVETVVLPDGEAFKNIEVLQKIWDAALEHRWDWVGAQRAGGDGEFGHVILLTNGNSRVFEDLVTLPAGWIATPHLSRSAAASSAT